MKTPLFRPARVFLLACHLCLGFSAAATPAVSPAPAGRGYTALRLAGPDAARFPTADYVAQGGPAALAGVQVGDEIIAIDHAPTPGRSLPDLRHILEGPAETSVALTLRRSGIPDQEVILIRRTFFAAYTVAADAGDPLAASEMGSIYERGLATPRDYRQALVWYHKAADANDKLAQRQLGYMADYGLGTPRDPKAAVEWYAKAAAQGSAFAQRSLGTHYLYGDGVPADDHLAFYWFGQSAGQDDAVAEESLAYLYLKGCGIPQDPRVAFAWYYRSAEQDDANSQYNLASLYLYGNGVSKDQPAAFAWYYRAAVLGDAYSQQYVGYMYLSGSAVRRNPSESLRWYLRAEKQLPNDQALKRAVAQARLYALLEDPHALLNFDPSMLSAGLRRWLAWIFCALAIFYALGALWLLRQSFRVGEAGVKLPLTVGWFVFFLESQAVAACGLFLLGVPFGSAALLGVSAATVALPLIVSTLGSLRRRFWVPTTPLLQTGLYALGASVLILGLNFAFQRGYTWFYHGPVPNQPTMPLIVQAKTSAPWITALSVALLLPAAEEILCRGYLFETARRYVSGWNAVFVTALIFAGLHFQGTYFLPLFAFGLILGWTRLKTGSLWLPLFLHLLNNALSLIFSR